MKLPELTLGVSFAPKSQLRLILPATNYQRKQSFLVAGSHTPPLELTFGVLAGSTNRNCIYIITKEYTAEKQFF